ncbi:lysine N(6)-hydroxylase/L-ornithine N(5)-oxygenase family protein [Carnimonas bestiolae]|uniref:lysine N(6)-hydroxylase/L-ornithine N(5)-oxygenase family protein n=1 Tax=Carnimonas bestiolae TaxID=3402172 RepID=UPI003EDC7E34
MSSSVYDIVGVGIGPFNLSLAALAEPLEDVTTLFVDAREGFDWHPGMMLESAHLQTPFMSDLVTLADPTSRYSFLNFAKMTGRLYPFYIRENFFILRKEYNQYCQWVVSQLSNLRWGFKVVDIRYDQERDIYLLTGQDASNGERTTIAARHLVLGTGTQPWTPFDTADSARIQHSSHYLDNKQRLTESNDITVIGSGQSAAEIFYDLLAEIDQHHYALRWITRSPRYFPLEYTKLTLEMTSPEYIDYFFSLPADVREPLIKSQANLFKGIDSELINAIYDLLYQKRLDGPLDVTLLTNSQLDQIENTGTGLTLDFTQHEQQTRFSIDTEQLILATGYRYQRPGFISSLQPELNLDQRGLPVLDRHYRIDKRQRIFIQNYGLETHSLTIPDLGMGCYRNSVILAAILGREPYRVERSIAFQTFGAPHAQGRLNTARQLEDVAQ